MSRIGKLPIIIPENVKLDFDKKTITVGSNNHQLTLKLPNLIKLEKKDNQLIVKPTVSSRQAKANHGLTRSLIQNAVIGVSQGFSKTLEIQGTGFKVNPKGQGIELLLGFSHPIEYFPPKGIKLEIQENKFITVSGINKQLVGQVAAKIKNYKTPDSYKGKGIRYKGEHIPLKPGKAAKAAAEGA